MALDRGFWLRDQASDRFGAWLISLGWTSSTAVSGFDLAGTAASRYRLEVLNAR